jgi:prepilin-type N-terminal cleavage/methylation domain-containing protein
MTLLGRFFSGRGARVSRLCRRGFSLLETILALMVFSIAVVALVGAINGMGNASVEARRTREVQAQLEAMMLDATRKPPQEIVSGQQSYETGSRQDGVDYHLAMQIIELANADGQTLPGLYSVKATARWTEAGAKQEISADTLTYPPLFYAPR